ncbi:MULTISPECIES: portal protein [unclassified Janthinobacterium]|uniref:portal protein n=1 Tax=unclassified Janthinobacterium TaxID=2610881 RepID=UPI00034B1B51|nr:MULTISPECIES: portal protein [unclassified Janthinobacterium]MEC5161712.1 hypothetical protein [Janthinobacterium sp. CG_S6]
MAELSQRQLMFNRLGQLKTERASWMAHWQELSNYLSPRQGRYFVTDRNQGGRRHNNIYDNTGTRALGSLAAGLMGGLTSPARPWFRLATADEELNKHPAVKEWLNDCTNTMLTVFQRSNTYRALHQVYKELGVFGTAANIVMPSFDNIIHSHPLTTGEFCIATDFQGKVCTMYREFQLTVSQMVKEFGRNKCSPSVQNLYDRGALDQWITIAHCIEPRADRDASMLDALNMAWKDVYFEIGGNDDKLLRESGFKRFPAMCPRWDVEGGDIYGNSPGMEALGDIKQLQHEQLRKAQGIDYMTKPPLQVPTSMKNRDVETMPGGITFVDAGGGQGIKSAFEVNLNLSYLLDDIQDVRQRVRGSFYADLFLMISSGTDGRMTATEVAERHEEKMLMLGPVLERLQDELLDPLIEITFERMLESRIVPPPPPQLQGQELSVQLVSMLAQAQRAIATNGVDRFVGNLGSIAQFKPEVLDKFNADKWADQYSDMLGVSPDLIVPDDQVQAIRQRRAQAQAQAAQQQQNNVAADTAQKLGATPTSGGNAASDVMSMFSQ